MSLCGKSINKKIAHDDLSVNRSLVLSYRRLQICFGKSATVGV
jgi:hypothetical protein